MAESGEEKPRHLPAKVKDDIALDVSAVLVSAVPWLGGPVSSILSGISVQRKVGRVKEALDALAEELRNFKSEASEQYVKTEEFEELFRHTLKLVAEEIGQEKRRLYRTFLSGVIREPEEPYDEKRRHLRTLEDLQGDHLQLLRAILQEPEMDRGTMGSPIGTLQKRLGGVTSERIRELVEGLDRMGVTKLSGNLATMMTGHGAADLRGALTPYGKRLMSYIKGAE